LQKRNAAEESRQRDDAENETQTAIQQEEARLRSIITLDHEFQEVIEQETLLSAAAEQAHQYARIQENKLRAAAEVAEAQKAMAQQREQLLNSELQQQQ